MADKILSIKRLAEIAGINNLGNLVKQALGKRALEDPDQLTYEEGFLVLCCIRLTKGLSIKLDQAKDIMLQNGIHYKSRDAVVRVTDDGILVTKMRLKEFRASCEGLMDQAKVEPEKPAGKKPSEGDEGGDQGSPDPEKKEGEGDDAT